jgi:eukaryotic-like serine/threonine-protein kinase
MFPACARTVSLRDVCAALTVAHRRHLVHRDLKPENIFLMTTEPREVAKVLDFGIAKFLSNSPQQLTADTAPGAVLGTPRYMSPEQRRGEEVDQTWDLWALAVVTYEMLTGSYPFDNTATTDWFGSGPGISFTPVTRNMPDAPLAWQQFFERSFARDPARRYSSAESLLSELGSTLG